MLKKSRKLMLIIALLIIASLFLILINAFFITRHDTKKLHTANVYKTGPHLNSFTLHDYNGKTFNTASLRGHWTLLFFGYMQCPDVCPMILGQIRDIWQQYNLQQQSPAKFVFVDISNKITNPDEFKAFVQRFNPQFLGAYGSKDALESLTVPLGVYYQQTIDRIDHTGQIFLINPQGMLAATFNPPFSNQDFIDDLYLLTK